MNKIVQCRICEDDCVTEHPYTEVPGICRSCAQEATNLYLEAHFPDLYEKLKRKDTWGRP